MNLAQDPDYLDLVDLYAKDLDALDKSFMNAWYKLTTRDMGPITRCVGSDVPPAQDFQLPLPDPAHPPVPKGVYKQAEGKIKSLMGMKSAAIDPDMPDGEVSYAALFVTLAFQCMDSFRSTDYFGGCNGARIRFSPEKDWDVNVDMDKVSDWRAVRGAVFIHYFISCDDGRRQRHYDITQSRFSLCLVRSSGHGFRRVSNPRVKAFAIHSS